MNIFAVDADSGNSANMLCLAHVCKMIVESAQMLSTGYDPAVTIGIPYPNWTVAQFNHPCCVWVRESSANWEWLWNHGNTLAVRYARVYGKTHKCASMYTWFSNNMNNLIPILRMSGRLTAKPRCMPARYSRHTNIYVAYRQYYIDEKAYFAKWESLAAIPAWWPYRTNAFVRNHARNRN
jgi:hypothetical protein